MKKLFALLLALTLVLSLAACGGGGGKPIFTAEKYARLETGMTYEEVVEIIGFKGQLSNEAGSTRVYNWDHLSKLDGKVDNNAVVTLYFSNDNEDKTYTLIQKNQTGFNLDDVDTPNSTDSTPEAEGVRLPLTRLQPFSENRAWVNFEDSGKAVRTALIDEKGNIVITLDDTQGYCAPFTDGVSFYLKSATDFTFIDASGKVLYKNDNTASAPLQLMGYANGHFVVAKYEASFDKTAWYLGTIDKTGKVKNEFKAITEKAGYSSSDSFLEPKIREIYKEGYNHRNNFEYLGENIVNFGRKSGIYYSLDTNQVKYNSAYDVFSKFSDGKMLVVYNGTIFVGPDLDFDKATAVPTMPFYATGDIGYGGNISEGASSYSEGLAFGRLKDSPFTKGYYDTNGHLAFSLGFLSGNDFSGGVFSGGYAPILAKGADGKSYLTVIDKSGNKQYELLAVDKCDIDQSANGYVAATIGGKSIIVDPKGSVKTPGTDDLSGISNTSFGDVSGGFFIIDKTYVSLDGKTIIKDILKK